MKRIVAIIALNIFSVIASMAVTLPKQTSEEADTMLMLNEISVTAIKQGGTPLNVSVTKLDAAQIARQEVISAKTAAELVPNLYIPDYGSRMTSTIYVRGLGARIDQPVMGLNIDNVPILNKDNYDFDIADISNIEVLRGAQSTLFGRNTMGGVINIYTLSPLAYQGTRLALGYASGNTLRGKVGVYKKLSHNFGLGVNAQILKTDGFFTNEYNGKKCDKETQFSARLKADWRINNQWSAENTFALSRVLQGGYPYRFFDTGKISYNDTCFYRRTTITDGLTVKYSGKHFTASSITSVQYINDNMTLDQDFLPEPYFTLTQARNEWALTQDIVLRESNQRKAYQWVTGAFGFYRRMNMSAPVTFLDTGIKSLIEDHRNEANPDYPIRWDSRVFPLYSDFTMPTYGVALYHQSSYDWNQFTFTAGMRVDYEHASLSYHSKCSSGYNIYEAATGQLYKHMNIDIDDGGKLSKSFFEILPKVSVTYHLPSKESSIYATVSKGHKAGGFNTQMFSDVLQQRVMYLMGIGMKYDINEIVSYKPEKAWTYEVGGHFSWLNGDLKADVSLFYIHCIDQQLTMFPDGTTTGRIMTNAGRSRSFGGEASLRAMFTRDMGVTASYGYTNARFVEFNNGIHDYSGKRVPYAPYNTIFAEAFYSHPITGCGNWLNRVTFDVNVRGVGKIYWNEDNSMEQPFYATFGASVKFQGKHYSLEFWGRNLTNADYDTFYFVSMGHEFLQQGKPRQAGVTLSLNF